MSYTRVRRVRKIYFYNIVIVRLYIGNMYMIYSDSIKNKMYLNYKKYIISLSKICLRTNVFSFFLCRLGYAQR